MYNLSPIQNWFLSSGWKNKNYFNQTFSIICDHSLSIEALRDSIFCLIQQYDILRSYFRKKENQWSVRLIKNDVVKNSKLIYEYELNLMHDQLMKNIFDISSELQNSIDIEIWPLFRVLSIKSFNKQYLIMIAHHLIIDGDSWCILLKKLCENYKKILSGNIKNEGNYMPYYKAFSDILEKNNEEIRKSEIFWISSEKEMKKSPCFLKYENNANTIAAAESEIMSLGSEFFETIELVLEKHKKITANDLFAISLSITLKDWVDCSRVSFVLERPGDSAIHIDSKIKNTVGWKTEIFPVTLFVPDNPFSQKKLLPMFDSLSEYVLNGFYYQYLSSNNQISNVFKDNNQRNLPSVALDYFVNMDSLADELKGWGHPAFLPLGDPVPKDEIRPFLLEIGHWVIDKKLQIAFTYNPTLIKKKRVLVLLPYHIENLRRVSLALL